MGEYMVCDCIDSSYEPPFLIVHIIHEYTVKYNSHGKQSSGFHFVHKIQKMYFAESFWLFRENSLYLGDS